MGNSRQQKAENRVKFPRLLGSVELYTYLCNEYETRKGKKPESSFENGRKQTRHDQYVAGKLRKVSS